MMPPCANITYFDDNLTAYVNKIMGPRCMDSTVTAVTVMLYSLIVVFGGLGNTFTCLIIWRNSYMHTATNYYLFSLAVSDLISLLLGLPFELHTTLTYLWPDQLPELVCKLRSFVTEATSYASVLTITAFSVERWLAICFPLKVKLFSKSNRAIKVIILIWTIACTSAMPIAFMAMLNRLPLPEGYRAIGLDDRLSDSNTTRSVLTEDGLTIKNTDICALDFSQRRISSILLNFSFYCFFLVPMLTICVLYIHIGLTVRTASNNQEKTAEMQTHDVKRITRKMTVIRMLAAVVVCFFVCWLPFHVQRISSMYFDIDGMSPEATGLFHMVFFVSGYFYYANSAVNPILYNVLNSRFRRAFVRMLCGCVGIAQVDSQQQQQTIRYSGGLTGHSSRAVSISGLSLGASIITSIGSRNRCPTMPSNGVPMCRNVRTNGHRILQLSKQNVGCFNDDRPCGSPSSSPSTGLLNERNHEHRERSRTCEFLMPPSRVGYL